jgi:anti-anti-sigma factor
MVSIHGDVDLAAAPHLAARLRLALARTRVGVIVDLTNCTLLDSAGISVLLGAKRRARERAIPMCVVAPPDGICRRALEVVGCTSTLVVVDDRLAAIATIDRDRAPLEIPAHD